MIVYICIGNSDDKLTQAEWAEYVLEVRVALLDCSYDPNSGIAHTHGSWFSEPSAEWQNACWCVDVDPDRADPEELKDELRRIAKAHRQKSITWAVAETEFLRGTDG